MRRIILDLATGEQTVVEMTDAEIAAHLAAMEADKASRSYAEKRASEYPPMADYLDGIVKGDQAQIDAYVAACRAVKAKYPKG